MATNPESSKNVAAIRESIQLLELETDPQALLRHIEKLASGKGRFDLLVAANEIRHLVCQRVGARILARAVRAVLAGLEDENLFRYYHDPFDTVSRTLYLAWGEFSPDCASPLPKVPDWPALLANEALRNRYHQLYAPDVLQSPVGTNPEWDFTVRFESGTQEPEIRRIQEEREENWRRFNRLQAIFEYETLKSVILTLEQDTREPGRLNREESPGMRGSNHGFLRPSTISLLYPITAAIWSWLVVPANTPGRGTESIGYGLANLGYLLLAAAIYRGTFLAFGLKRRLHVIIAALVAWVLGTGLVNLPLLAR